MYEVPAKPLWPEETAMGPEQHHRIGKNENTYEDFGAFIRKHRDDPAVVVCPQYTCVLGHH